MEKCITASASNAAVHQYKACIANLPRSRLRFEFVVILQEYTLIKLKALQLPGKLAGLASYGSVYFMAATLRPETMYGQTNCWVLPDGKYGAFQGPGHQVYIMCARDRF